MAKVITQKAINKALVRSVLRKGNDWHTFKDIRHETGLGIKQVMAVTGKYPYDIIGTQQGYKLLKKASDDEVSEATAYLCNKAEAMLVRAHAFRDQLGAR